jgi:iron complex transport system permease protein
MNSHPRLILALVLVASLAALPLALSQGALDVPLWQALRHPQSADALLLWELRLPRVLLGWGAGATLALAGVLLQALFRNPLASPYTLGISSGAALGAALVLATGSLAGLAQLPPGGVQAGAWAGSLLAALLVWALGRQADRQGGGGLLLAGVALNFTFSSLLLLVQVLADPSQSLRILRWLMGGLDGAAWADLPLPLLLLAVAAPLCWALARSLDLLSLGEDSAHSRGLRVGLLRGIIFWLSSTLVATLVASTGPIGFVGLMAPHAARLLVGPGHRRLLPAAMALGATLLVLCDALARRVIAPAELPVGVVTACLGGTLFLLMLVQKRRA